MRCLWFLAACLLSGCGVSFQPGNTGGAAGDPEQGGDGGVATQGGGGIGAGGAPVGGNEAGAGGTPEPTCPSALAGPAIVSVAGPRGLICIDATEVTIAHYKAFVDTAPLVDTSDPLCGWKPDFLPAPPGFDECTVDQFDDINFGDHPMSCVDWCDARAYCTWAGKRLCGGHGGAALAFEDHDDPTKSEWSWVCTNGGTQSFPYGASYDGSACVSDDYDGVDNDGGGATYPVGSVASCVGGFPGVFDLSGNVWEWEDACDTMGAAQDHVCQHSGGSFWDDESSVRCDQDGYYPRSFRNKNFGFRCCADPQ